MFFLPHDLVGGVRGLLLAAGLTAGGRPLSREEEFGKDQSRLS
jgi:hypothetical protein